MTEELLKDMCQEVRALTPFKEAVKHKRYGNIAKTLKFDKFPSFIILLHYVNEGYMTLPEAVEFFNTNFEESKTAIQIKLRAYVFPPKKEDK